MTFWMIMGAVIYLDNGNTFDLENVSTFSPMNGNKSFIYNSKNECEAGLLGIQQREEGRLVTTDNGDVIHIKDTLSNLKFVYDCSEVVFSK